MSTHTRMHAHTHTHTRAVALTSIQLALDSWLAVDVTLVYPPPTPSILLLSLSPLSAAAILKGSGDSVTLTVAKQAAVLYGLSNLITQSSPSIARRMEALESGT